MDKRMNEEWSILSRKINNAKVNGRKSPRQEDKTQSRKSNT